MRRRWPTTAWLVVALAIVAIRLPVAGAAVFEEVGRGAATKSPFTAAAPRGKPLWRAAVDALTVAAEQRIARAAGIDAALLAVIRTAIPPDGTVVLFCPYPGPVWENLVRLQWERTKNLVYPQPREVRFARSATALDESVDTGAIGRLLVLDATQEDVPLPGSGVYERVDEAAAAVGPRLLRAWRLRGLR